MTSSPAHAGTQCVLGGQKTVGNKVSSRETRRDQLEAHTGGEVSLIIDVGLSFKTDWKCFPRINVA